MLIPTEQVVIQALDHETRRIILRLVQARAYSFSELMKLLDISSGKLNYHLSQIAGFIGKNEHTGKYESTVLGVRAIDLLDLLQQNLTDQETSLLCEAYVTQIAGKEISQEISPSYLKGALAAIDMIQGLVTLAEEEGTSPELPDYLSQIESKVKGYYSRNQKPMLLNYWKGVQVTIKEAKIQLLHNKPRFPQFLSTLRNQAIGLQDHLGYRDAGFQITPTRDKEWIDLPEGINWLIDSLLMKS